MLIIDVMQQHILIHNANEKVEARAEARPAV